MGPHLDVLGCPSYCFDQLRTAGGHDTLVLQVHALVVVQRYDVQCALWKGVPWHLTMTILTLVNLRTVANWNQISNCTDFCWISSFHALIQRHASSTQIHRPPICSAADCWRLCHLETWNRERNDMHDWWQNRRWGTLMHQRWFSTFYHVSRIGSREMLFSLLVPGFFWKEIINGDLAGVWWPRFAVLQYNRLVQAGVRTVEH